MKHLIVGGVAGGATAAARIRRADEHAEIIMFEKGNDISYANCGLPYYIGGVIDERDKLFLQTPQSFGQRFNVDVRVKSEVVAVNPERKEVTVRNHRNETYIESYDKLLLSPGASPFRPAWMGGGASGVRRTGSRLDSRCRSCARLACRVGAGLYNRCSAISAQT